MLEIKGGGFWEVIVREIEVGTKCTGGPSPYKSLENPPTAAATEI